MKEISEEVSFCYKKCFDINAIAKGLSTKWGDTVYVLGHMRGKLGLDFHSEICINQEEVEFISSCNKELLELKRKIQGNTAQMPKKSSVRNTGVIEL